MKQRVKVLTGEEFIGYFVFPFDYNPNIGSNFLCEDGRHITLNMDFVVFREYIS